MDYVWCEFLTLNNKLKAIILNQEEHPIINRKNYPSCLIKSDLIVGHWQPQVRYILHRFILVIWNIVCSL